VDGEYRQLSSAILQIENEYYSDIRPKRVTLAGEHPSAALHARGVEYIEVRIMDLDPFSAIGLQASTLYFLDVFLVHCMLRGDEPLLAEECHTLRVLQQEIATHGKDPERLFDFGHGNLSIGQQGEKLLAELAAVATTLTRLTDNPAYLEAVQQQQAAMIDSQLLPSSKVLAMIQHQGDYVRAMQCMAKQQQDEWLNIPLSTEIAREFAQQAERSLTKQYEIEAADDICFDDYLAAYMQPQ